MTEGFHVSFIEDGRDTVEWLQSQDGTHINVTFFNGAMNGECELYWISYDGRRELETTLSAGSTHTVSTETHHPWILWDKATSCSILIQIGDECVRSKTQFSLVFDPTQTTVSFMAQSSAVPSVQGTGYDSTVTISLLPQ